MTPNDLFQIAQRNVIVSYVMAAWRAGKISYECALITAVVHLANENERLIKDATVAMASRPLEFIMPSTETYAKQETKE